MGRDTILTVLFLNIKSLLRRFFQDIVQLIEDLEAACIRFVHFSKENELRSRVGDYSHKRINIIRGFPS